MDGVGIDAYFPLSDWRGGTHLDSALASSVYDLDYLSANLRGGEGFDFYYQSAQERAEQIRTPITDGAYSKPWMFRYKDLLNWWSNPHVNRQGGIETSQSPWVPSSKPFWLTEVGCPAIDRGANQPNVFYDPKSAESALPYFSGGTRDDLMQRRYIEAFLGFYNDPVNNPQSDVYGGPMIDMDAAHIWCWDARPYPDFPARSDVWADGPNWERGHWLTGRTGLVLVADVVRDLVTKSGVRAVDVSDITGVLEGYAIDRPMSTRAALGPLAMIYGFDMVERAAGLSFKAQGGRADAALSWDDLAVSSGADFALSRIKEDPEDRALDMRLHYIDGARDHQPVSLFARDLQTQTVRILDAEVPIVMDAGFAKLSAERLLTRAQTLDQSVSFNLPPYAPLEVGDRISLPEQSGVWQINRLDRAGSQGGGSRVTARAAAQTQTENPRAVGSTPTNVPPIAWTPKPKIIYLDIPAFNNAARRGPLVGVQSDPFSRAVISSANEAITVSQPTLAGETKTRFAAGPVGRFDLANIFEFSLSGGEFSGVTDIDLLSGENRFAVQTRSGWEILQIAQLTLIAPNHYRASRLLRGLAGTDADMDVVDIGAQIVWLGQGLETLPITQDAGDVITISAAAAGRAADALPRVYHARHLRPLSPVHAAVRREGGALKVSWIRRTRAQGSDSWAGLDVALGEDTPLYQVQAFKSGEAVETVQTQTETAIIETIDADSLQISQGSTAYGFGAVLTVDMS